jgi:hypothetical protein
MIPLQRHMMMVMAMEFGLSAVPRPVVADGGHKYSLIATFHRHFVTFNPSFVIAKIFETFTTKIFMVLK